MMIDHIEKLQFAVDVAMATLIWLVQLVIYPAFRAVVQETFEAWHQRYMETISIIVVPLMLLQALCHGCLSVVQPTILHWGASASVLGAWIVTFALSVPCHQTLRKSGYQTGMIERLVKTNWLRTALWSLTLILGLV